MMMLYSGLLEQLVRVPSTTLVVGRGAPVGLHRRIDTDGKWEPKQIVTIDITTTI